MTKILRESIMKDNLIEVIISKHYLIILELVEYATRHLSTCIHYIRDNIFMDTL